MKIDITFRDLNAAEAAAILQMGKANGVELALFLATPGAPVMTAAPAAVAAATGIGTPAVPGHVPTASAGVAMPVSGRPVETPPAAAPVAAGGATSAPDFLTFSRAPNVKAVVKALLDSGVTEQAAILARCEELRGQGVPALSAVPADQLADRVAGSVAALT